MIVTAIILAAVCIALLVAHDRQRRGTERLILNLEKRHRDERSELADRIQAPAVLPTRRIGPAPEPRDPQDARAFASVGRVLPFRDETKQPDPEAD